MTQNHTKPTVIPDGPLFLHGEIRNGLYVFLFQRELSPRHQVDFRNGIFVHHSFGWVLFAFDLHKNQIVFKGGGRESAEAVVKWTEDFKKGIEFKEVGVSPFRDYNFERVSEQILGSYPEESSLQIVALSLSRCNRRSLSPLTLGPPEFDSSIRKDLLLLKNLEAIKIHSLCDITQIVLGYRGNRIKIDAEPGPSGTLVFKVDDSNIDDKDVEELLEVFLKQFGVPLNVRLDLRTSAFGHAPSIAALLDATTLEAVPAYLQSDAKSLVDAGVLEQNEDQQYYCDDPSCRSELMHIAIGDCPNCHSPLKIRQRKILQRNVGGIYSLLQKVLRHHSKRRLRKGLVDRKTKQATYQLESSQHGDIPFNVLFADQVSPHLINYGRRFHRPFLIVHTHGFKGGPYTDAVGMVNVHLADILAAQRGPEELSLFFDSLEERMQDCQRRTEERLCRAAAAADENFAGMNDGELMPTDYHDQDFEHDVFAILRRLFPFTDKWGGGNKADGFVSATYLKTGSTRDLAKLNFSYDAKLTRKLEVGYELCKSEKRKAFEYVLALQQQPLLQTDGNRLDAHVFISNLIGMPALKGMASHFRISHNDRSLEYPVPVIVMRTSFLLALHRFCCENHLAFLKRELLFPRLLANHFRIAGHDGYALLDGKIASELIKDLLSLPAIANPISGEQLRANLDLLS